ncbi:MAG TPA: PP0621 family protein [Rhodocyclaceae bacterium]|jgi:formylmethanofuran dehydrogenase subunit E
MLKWFLWFLIVLIFWGLFRSRNRLKQADVSVADSRKSATMVSCAQCKIYLPEGEALKQDGNVFCSKDHYEQWKRRS